MHSYAAPAYVEAIYATAVPIGSGRWLSPKTADLWLSAARAAAGADMRAFGAYAAKAILFGDEAQAAEGYDLLDRAVEARGDQPKPTPHPDRDSLLKIARLYVDMNMHPRALQLLADYKDLLAPEGQELADKWKAEWSRLVAEFCAGRTPCTLFGQDVSTPEKGAGVRVPWPCEKQALAEATKILESLPLLRAPTTSAAAASPSTRPASRNVDQMLEQAKVAWAHDDYPTAEQLAQEVLKHPQATDDHKRHAQLILDRVAESRAAAVTTQPAPPPASQPPSGPSGKKP
jgi:hypothetical protein